MEEKQNNILIEIWDVEDKNGKQYSKKWNSCFRLEKQKHQTIEELARNLSEVFERREKYTRVNIKDMSTNKQKSVLMKKVNPINLKIFLKEYISDGA